MHLRRYLDRLTPQADVPRAIDQGAARGTARLKPDDHDMGLLTPHVMLEVMTYAAAGTHAAAGNNDRAGMDLVELNRFFRRPHITQVR